MTSIYNLKLRPLRTTDLKTYYQLVSDHQIARGARFHPVDDVENAKRLLNDDLRHATSYAVTLNYVMIGMISLYPTIGNHGAPNPSRLELAYMVLSKDQGHGYMTQALGILINYLQRHSDVKQLVALVDEHNHGSRKVLCQNHFHTYRSVLGMNSGREDLIYQRSLIRN